MENSKPISSQTLMSGDGAVGGVNLTRDKSAEFCAMWQPFVRSGLFLAFVICVTLLLGAAVWRLFEFLPLLQLALESNIQTNAILFILGAAIVFLIYMTTCTIGVWLFYVDIERIQKGSAVLPGLSLVIWSNRIMLGLLIAAFIVTLPAFNEWMVYNEANDLFLQVIYVLFVLSGIWCAALMTIARKIKEKLSVWCSGEGPIVAMAVVCIVINTLLLIIGVLFDLWLCSPVFYITTVLWVILLFMYNGKVARIR